MFLALFPDVGRLGASGGRCDPTPALKEAKKTKKMVWIWTGFGFIWGRCWLYLEVVLLTLFWGLPENIKSIKMGAHRPPNRALWVYKRLKRLPLEYTAENERQHPQRV